MAQDIFEQLHSAVMQAESRGQRYDKKGNLLTSPKGAQGEMQVMPKTQRDPGYGVVPAKGDNPDEIARVGRDYLKAMVDKYGDTQKALMAYNWGPGNTDNWLASGADPKKVPAETRGYVSSIMSSLGGTKQQRVKAASADVAPVEKSVVKSEAPAATPAVASRMGTGYQAALALAYLGDDEEEADKQAKEDRGPSAAELMADHKSVNALEGLDLGYTSPFEQPKVQKLAHGGVVYREEGSPEEGEQSALPDMEHMEAPRVHAFKNAGKMGIGDREIQNMMIGLGMDNALVSMNLANMKQGEKENLAQSLMAAYRKQMGDVNLNANMIRPVDAPPGVYMGALSAGIPVGNRDQVMLGVNGMRTPDESRITGYNLGYSGEVGPGRLNAMMMQPKGGSNRSYQIEYQIPLKANGGIVHRAEGSPEAGEVKEPWLPQVSSYSELTAQDMYPGQGGQFDQRDAARHMLAAGTLARKYGPGTAEFLGNAHEIATSPLRYIGSKLGISQMPADYAQDLHNNKLGIELAARSKSQKELEDLVMQMAEQHRLQQTAGKPWTGKPVRRGDGSPETGEIGPAFGNPNIQRQGAKARALAAQRDVNTLPDPKTYAAVSGFMGTPFEQQGWSVFHPNRQGIEKAADAGFYTGVGAQIAPVAAPALKGAAKIVGSGLNERMLSGQSLTPGFNTPAPINFAIKEPGGYFLHNRYEGMDDIDSFLKNFAGVKKDDESPLNQWMYKRYGNYMRGQMGTEMDPFVKGADAGKVFHFMDNTGKVHMPQYAEHAPYLREKAGLPMGGFAKTSKGQDMETAIDTSLSPVAVGDVSDRSLTEHMMKLRDKDPSAPVYEVLHEELDDVLKPTELRQSLRTMMKDKTLPPEYQLTEDQLKKMSLLDASEKVAQFDKYVVARDEEIRMRAAESVPVFKQYDDGSKWLAPEDTLEDAASKEYVLQTGKHAGWCTERESNCTSYGGGDNRLFILADKEGKPLVQINKEEMVPGVDIWLKYGMDPKQGEALREEYMIHQLEQMPDYQQWAKANSRVAIGEIKGRNNNMRLTGDELQKARDFVRSGTWDSVGEIENVGLTDLRDEVYKAGKATDLAPIENEAKRKFGTIYLTDDELNQIKPMLDESSGAASFKTGGSVERVSDDNRRYL